MNKIVENQQWLQEQFSRMEGYPLMNPSEFSGYTVGEVYDFIRHMKFCLNEELTELMEAMGNESRDIHKPWSKDYFKIREARAVATDHMMEEGIDALCFMINILLAVGITPNNIHDEYEKVYNKNLMRINKYHEEQRKREDG